MILEFSLAFLCMTVIVLTALLTPCKEVWQDDTDCSRIVLHTVRVLTQGDRVMQWESRYWLFHIHGDKFAPRLPLQPPEEP